MPSQGWIKTIRMALKMTSKQLGKRIQKTQQNVSILEKNEVEGTITLQSLEEMARVLNCKFYYAFIPEDSLEERFKKQILKKAQEEMAYISHSMRLENQDTSREEIEHQMKEIARELEQKNTQRIWDAK
ncbi:helix-turn-helix protein [Caedimonas varicaedens]|uniref:Helix-turn-helix protein n=1 Tax=Caedimonas varicaedens TaxID=1629334 RepID=A0A0K8MER7_9PROT|nr:helix-turn-helix protein [Caedimonas varicaedens]